MKAQDQTGTYPEPLNAYGISPVGATEAGPVTPEFLRLPPAGQTCPWSGLRRAYLNTLILPSEANSFKPPVRSFVLRKRGAQRGVRLIDAASLRAFILSHPETKRLEG